MTEGDNQLIFKVSKTNPKKNAKTYELNTI